MSGENKKPPPLHEYKEATLCSRIHGQYGINSLKYNNLHWLHDNIFVLSAGKFVQFLDISTGKIEWLLGPEDGGVGFVAVHPNRDHFIVGERRPSQPKVKIYNSQSRSLEGELNDGAVVGFAACAFDVSGSKLATVASEPDYTLCIWDWSKRFLLLRNKCFSADVLSISFSRFDNALLVSGGSGHIKFWQTAQTFTGTKLQGTLGKFGRMEISNVSAFEVLSDGKVLSGSENGSLLLWEGDLIKCVFVHSISATPADENGLSQSSYEPLHAGPITAVKLLFDSAIVLTAGEDGYIRCFDRVELERAEGQGALPLAVPTSLWSMKVDEVCPIRSFTERFDTGEWVVADTAGFVRSIPMPSLEDIRQGGNGGSSPKITQKVAFNGNAVICSDICGNAHTIVTGSGDGVVRLVDYINNEEVFSFSLPGVPSAPSPVVFVKYFRKRNITTSPYLLAGFENGILVLLKQNSENFSLIGQWKPHTGGMFALAMNSEETFLCTVSYEKTVFFFKIESERELIPIGFCRTPLDNIQCAEWDIVGEAGGCLIGHRGGQVLAISLPENSAVCEETNSFEFECKFSYVALRQRKLPPPMDEDEAFNIEEEDILEVKDDGPWAVASIKLLEKHAIYVVAFEKEELIYTYTTAVRYPALLDLPPLPPTGIEPPNYIEDPLENLCYRDKFPEYVNTNMDPNLIFVICRGSFVLERNAMKCDDVSLVAQAHDSTLPKQVTTVHLSFDASMIVSTGADGLVVSQVRNGCTTPQCSSLKIAKRMQPSPQMETDATHATGAPLLSIQEQKELDDQLREAAEKERLVRDFLDKINDIHQEYIEILESNANLPTAARLSKSEVVLDHEMEEYFNEEIKARVKEARKAYLVDSLREDVRTKKLLRRFVDNLIYDRVVLHSFSKDFTVTNFRTANPAWAIEQLENEICDLERSDDESDEDKGPSEPALQKVENTVTTNSFQQPEISVGAASQEKFAHSKVSSSSVKQQLNKLDERRAERDQRRRGYEEVLASRPDPLVDDKALNAQLEQDNAERGECVLRTDPGYQTRHKEFKPTAKAKLQRLISLQRFIVSLRTEFNEEFLKLRNEKKEKLQILNAFIHRINEINRELEPNAKPSSIFTLQEDEEPERVFDISHEDLEEYNRTKQEELAKAELAKKAQRGFGADLAGATAVAASTQRSVSTAPGHTARNSSTHHSSQKKSNQFSISDRGSRASTVFAVMSREKLSAELQSKLDNVKLSPQEEEERGMRRAELVSEKTYLEDKCASMKNEFNDKLFQLLYKRGQVDCDICLAELQSLLVFREYQLLLVYRSRDKDLKKQLTLLKQQREEIESLADSLQNRIEEEEQKSNSLQEQRKEHKHTAELFINEKFPSDKVAYILKIYNRKIKRKIMNGDEDNDDITSDDEDDIEEEDDIGEEVCPASCSVEAWDKVLQLRNVKLDIQDALNASKASLEKLIQEQQNIKEKTLNENKENTKRCVEKKVELEKEKRQVLNMLRTIVPLYCSQIKCLSPDGKCPGSLKDLNVVVISNEELARLLCRIHELAEIKQERRSSLENGVAETQDVQQQKVDVQKAHAVWEGKVHEVMMLKFGQHVDLELLEQCGTTHRIETKKEELRQLELRWERELRKQENKINALRAKLQNRLIDNTHLLQDFGKYEEDRQQLQKTLAHSTANASTKFRSSRVATREDRENLRDLISAQQAEIAALTAEIMMLKRKGGHAYNPALY